MFKTYEEARDFYAPIPEEKWCINWFNNDAGQNCALGLTKPEASHAEMTQRALNGGFQSFAKLFPVVTPAMVYSVTGRLPQVNNGADPNYQQPTPKQRVLAYIDDLIAKRDGDKIVEQVQELVNTPTELVTV